MQTETEKRRSCVFCGRRAIAAWLDTAGNFTPVCSGHQWIAVAACGSAQAEYIKLTPPRDDECYRARLRGNQHANLISATRRVTEHSGD